MQAIDTDDEDGQPLHSLAVLLVDDDLLVLKSTVRQLKGSGFTRIVPVQDGREAMAQLRSLPIGVAVIDLSMPHLSGQELLRLIKAEHPEVPVIVMTASIELDTAVQCMREGAADYLVKPVEPSRLTSAVRNALRLRSLEDALASVAQMALSEPGERHPAFAEVLSGNREMLQRFRYLEQLARTDQAIVLAGEAGTGKTLLAQAVHRISARKGPFLHYDVVADDLRFEDDLFGRARGANLSAAPARKGLIAEAANGTVLLDEIGRLGTQAQLALLRLLQDGTYRPLGADRLVQSRARILATTALDLEKEVEAGRLRRDLYYELRRPVQIPPLRARKGDARLLAAAFLERAAASAGRKLPHVPPELWTLLEAYAFPGNVSELETMCRDAIERHAGGALSLQVFKDAVARLAPSTHPRPAQAAGRGLLEAIGELVDFPTEEDVLHGLAQEAMRRANDNRTIAASLLGISRQTLSYRLKKADGQGGAD